MSRKDADEFERLARVPIAEAIADQVREKVLKFLLTLSLDDLSQGRFKLDFGRDDNPGRKETIDQSVVDEVQSELDKLSGKHGDLQKALDAVARRRKIKPASVRGKWNRRSK